MNPKTGFVQRTPGGRWQARVSYRDPLSGRRREIKRTFDTKIEARNALQKIVDLSNGGASRAAVRTLYGLLSYFETTFVHPADIRDGVKVAGYKDVRSIKSNIATIRRLIPDRVLSDLRYDVLYAFKRALFADTYTRSNKPDAKRFKRSFANINRILALLRHVLMIAERQRWIDRNPFRMGEPLISIASEKKRDRALTFEEEEALLAACDHDDRRHIRPIIVCAIDTGMRLGEILKMQWSQISLDERIIRIPREHTKTGQPRIVGITKRLCAELLTVAQRLGDSGSVFGRRSSPKQSWATAVKLAGLKNLRFHDLRHTFASRMASAGVEMMHVSRLLGHADLSMTFRYTNLNEDSIRENVERVDAYVSSHVN
jgi:integrase